MSLSKTIEAALNRQIEMEGNSSNFYLGIAYWCDHHALAGCKEFFLRQFDEERMHMMKIYEYLSDAGNYPVTCGLDKPRVDFSSIKQVFEAVLEQERKVTRSIHEIVKLCYEESDFSTLHFLQWYVEEQREEEVLIQSILDRIEVIGEGSQSLYFVDQEVNAINERELKAMENEA